MKVFLLSISFILLSFSMEGNTFCTSSSSPFSFNEENRASYNLFMQFKNSGISGLCIIKAENNIWQGSVINEFGIKAFDFTYHPNKQKITLLNVTNFINKWYIKRTIRNDWKYLLSHPNQKKASKNLQLQIEENGGFILENQKHQIRYVFTPLV